MNFEESFHLGIRECFRQHVTRVLCCRSSVHLINLLFSLLLNRIASDILLCSILGYFYFYLYFDNPIILQVIYEATDVSLPGIPPDVASLSQGPARK